MRKLRDPQERHESAMANAKEHAMEIEAYIGAEGDKSAQAVLIAQLYTAELIADQLDMLERLYIFTTTGKEADE